MTTLRRSGELVVPGDKLGVIEEFIPDFGTYVKDGSIYAQITGYVLMDLMNRKVSVYPLARKAQIPEVGKVVLGNVLNVQDSLATVRIVKVGRRYLSGFFTGLLHVSEASIKYTDTMYDVCRVGDIMRAKVISDKNRVYHLSTKGPNLGVVYAFCSRCGGALTLVKDDRKVRCVECGNVEKRKTASDYGDVAL